MTDHLEEELRQALQPAEPPAGFAARVLARLPPDRRVVRWWPAALAASLVLCTTASLIVLGHHQQVAGERARRQVIEALRLTSAKLDLAYRVVRNAPAAAGRQEEER